MRCQAYTFVAGRFHSDEVPGNLSPGSKFMIQANDAKVEWNPEKKHWQVVITVGGEVIRRQCANTPRDATESQLRDIAIATAKDEGYEVDSARVTVGSAPAGAAG